MKPSFVAGLLASFAGAVVACGAVVEPVPRQEPPPSAPPAPAVDAGRDTGPKPDAHVEPVSCSAPLAPLACPTTTPAPTTQTAINAFVKDNAIPLRCDGPNGKPAWDLEPLVELFGQQKIFMVGEVHGSNEIGIVSSLVLEQLASQKLVNIVAYELPMDLQTPMQNYVDTGRDPVADQIMRRGAPNFFGAILTKTARDLATKGISLRVGAVDIPYLPETASRAIQEVAQKLTAQKNTVLSTLPPPASEPPSADDITRANAYFDHIMANKTAICSELTPADCDRLDAMTHALWASTLSYDRGGNDDTWFARREVVIYHNMRTLMASPSDRMHLHMGAFHTNKMDFSAGSRMAKEYALTKGQVFSVAPAYGDGSVIWYGEDMNLNGEPDTVVSALSSAPAHPFFASTTRPSSTCVKNPLGLEPDPSYGDGTRADVYDGFIHYGKLTSERRPGDTKLARGLSRDGDVAARRLDEFRARVERRERAALASGAFARMSAVRR